MVVEGHLMDQGQGLPSTRGQGLRVSSTLSGSVGTGPDYLRVCTNVRE